MSRSVLRSCIRAFAAAGWLTVCLVGFGAAHLLAAEPTLLGHWPLERDAQDASGHGLHGQAEHVTFQETSDGARGAARFDGRTSQIRIDHGPTARGHDDFTVSAWVQLDEQRDDVPGDVVSWYDSDARRGFQLSVVTNAAATSSQANCRQVQFGVNADVAPSAWHDCGRPGNAVLVFGLCVFDGQLYAATCESGADEAGHVYRYDGEQRWTDCGRLDGANAVSTLAVFNGRLYAGTACYRLRGSALTDSANQTPGGRVFRYDGGTNWTDCGKLEASEALNGLVVYRGALHASSTYSPGVFRYEGETAWTNIGTPSGRRVEALCVFNGALYGGGYDAGEVYCYTPDEGWDVVGALEGNTQTYGFAVYQGSLHVGTWPSGAVYRYQAPGQWANVGRLGEEKEVMPLAVHHGQLLGGTLPLAQVYRYHGRQSWQNLGQLDTTPAVTYRRVWCMASFQGELFAGTLPSGHVYRANLGPCATHDRELASGWRHLVGVRQAGALRLYVDGELVGRSQPFDAALEITAPAPLWIGRGEHDHFHGLMRDVRLYRGALSADEIARIQTR